MLAALLLSGLTPIAVSGCTPPEAPSTPTPTALFASEEEAFAAAEEVYRDYNEALNNVDPSDTRSFDAVYALSSGDVQKADRKNLSTMHAEHHQIVGESQIVSFQGVSAAPPFEVVVAVICLDVSQVLISDADGISLVNPERPDVYPLEATFRQHDDALLLNSVHRTEEVQCDY